MATKEQYEFFQTLYAEEERTYEQLEGRAKVYLGIISAFLAGVLLKSEDVSKSAKILGVSWLAILAVATLLSIALLCVVYALRIRAYEGVADPLDVIAGFEGNGPTDAEFFEDRIADYAVAASKNFATNNKTATALAWACGLLIAAMILVFVVLALAFRNSL